MKGNNIQYASEIFSCEQKDKFAVLTLQEQAFEITTDLQVRKDYFSVLEAVEHSPEVLGLVQINSTEHGAQKHLEFLKSVRGGGIDIKSRPPEFLKRFTHSIDQITLKFANYTKPLIAGINGVSGLEYLGYTLAFDFRIATPNTSFMLPNLSLGLPPSGPLVFNLVRYLGPGKASEIIFSGQQPLSASEAQKLGLITSVVSEDELEQRCLEKLEELSAFPSIALSATRRMIQPEPAEIELFLRKSFDGVWAALMQMNK